LVVRLIGRSYATSGQPVVFYVHTDHLNTPRKVAQPTSGTLAWRWDTDPFGTAAPNQNPGGLGTFVYNLRALGQYYQAETGLNQNWNRDYDPMVGRYVESDPIGLRGGINTYAYAAGNPLLGIDPLGLDVTVAYFPGGSGHVGIGVNSSNTVGLYPLGFSFCNTVKGEVQRDQATQDALSKKGARYLVIHTTSDQDALIQNYINAPHNTYNLCSNQCTNFVREALRAGGVVLPVDATFDPIPETFFNALQSTYDPYQPFPGVP
jgi:RHS repeat-associated protein